MEWILKMKCSTREKKETTEWSCVTNENKKKHSNSKREEVEEEKAY